MSAGRRSPIDVGLAVWSALVFVFLFLPIIVIVISSFNTGRLLVAWEGSASTRSRRS